MLPIGYLTTGYIPPGYLPGGSAGAPGSVTLVLADGSSIVIPLASTITTVVIVGSSVTPVSH